jgi:hypothetical protein
MMRLLAGNNGGEKKMNTQMQGFKVIAGVEPKLALFEIRDGKYSNGVPSRTKGGAAPPSGFYFAEMLADGRLCYDEVWGPYPSAAAGERAARVNNAAYQAVVAHQAEGNIVQADIAQVRVKVVRQTSPRGDVVVPLQLQDVSNIH